MNWIKKDKRIPTYALGIGNCPSQEINIFINEYNHTSRYIEIDKFSKSVSQFPLRQLLQSCGEKTRRRRRRIRFNRQNHWFHRIRLIEAQAKTTKWTKWMQFSVSFQSIFWLDRSCGGQYGCPMFFTSKNLDFLKSPFNAHWRCLKDCTYFILLLLCCISIHIGTNKTVDSKITPPCLRRYLSRWWTLSLTPVANPIVKTRTRFPDQHSFRVIKCP